MIAENEKNRLAMLNSLQKDRYADIVKENVKKKYLHPDEELAILRKAVAYLFSLVGTLHDGEIHDSEFAEYMAYVEQCKAEAKKEVNG